ncbi:MAG: hypothetical protein LR015_03925 [Verrucomicrobia bacterium]|nr:hypothetical protein [Verrucomicrobiota bacterium]
MWEKNGVLFATIHVVGSFNNNQPSIPGAVEEFKERNAANLAWLQQVFSRASALDAPGVALFIQAQPFAHTWNMPGFMPGFREFLESLAAHAREYGRPVLLAHADEHRYRLDYGIAISSGAQKCPKPHPIRYFW